MSEQAIDKFKTNNPQGVNQYAGGKGLGRKDSSLYMRISSSNKRKLQEAARKQNMSLTDWLISLGLQAAES